MTGSLLEYARRPSLLPNWFKMNQDLFGFLPYNRAIEFVGGKISPVPEFDEVASWINNYTNEDGFLYPPTEYRVKVAPVTIRPIGRIPKTERPAHLHRVPPSHELCLFESGTPEEIRRGPGSFVIQLLAYLFGVRLQFHDWWFDSRLPIREKVRTHGISFSEKTIEEFLSHCYKTWNSWREREQKLITNVLFMHNRAPTYGWDWEQFTIEYMVLDGCYKLTKLLGVLTEKPSHGERIEALCKTFDIPIDQELVCKIVDLRNELFHETFWDGSQPCTAVSNLAFILPFHLRRLNQRLIPALLCYKTPYIQTQW